MLDPSPPRSGLCARRLTWWAWLSPQSIPAIPTADAGREKAHRPNRGEFRSERCAFSLPADLNATRNIGTNHRAIAAVCLSGRRPFTGRLQHDPVAASRQLWPTVVDGIWCNALGMRQADAGCRVDLVGAAGKLAGGKPLSHEELERAKESDLHHAQSCSRQTVPYAKLPRGTLPAATNGSGRRALSRRTKAEISLGHRVLRSEGGGTEID